MAGGCGRGVWLSGLAAGGEWTRCRRGRRELRRESGDPSGYPASGGEVAGAAFRERGSRGARVLECVGKNAGAAVRREGRCRRRGTDGMALQSFDKSWKQVF